jgi:hypothetical protein
VSFLNYAVYHRTVRWLVMKNWKLWERYPQRAKWQPHLSRGTEITETSAPHLSRWTEWNHRNLSPSPSWDLNPRIKKKTENSHKGTTVTFHESVWLPAGSTDPVLVQTHAPHTLTPYFFKTRFNIVPFFIRLDVSIGLPTKVLPEFIIPYPPFKSRSLHTPPLPHLNIPRTAVNKLLIPSLCHVIHSPVIHLLLVTNKCAKITYYSNTVLIIHIKTS